MTSRIRLPSCLVVATLLASALPALAQDDIGYPSVEAARSALMARDDVRLSIADGWFNVEDPSSMAIWTFAPETDPAHPAVVKRSVVEDGERIIIRMDIRCEGDAGACDALEEHFMSLNETVRDQAQEPSAEEESEQP